MKTRSLFLCCSMLALALETAVVPLAWGQQEDQPTTGIGISLNPAALVNLSSSTMFLPVGFSNIYVPVMVNPGLRIEPELGIYSTSSSDSYGSFSGTLLRVGVGVFAVRSVESSFRSYIGPRLGILSTSSKSTATGNPDYTSSEKDFYVGLCVGGEYLFSPHFSVGGEAQINYVSFGNPTVSPASSSSSTISRSIITNNALVAFRWYY